MTLVSEVGRQVMAITFADDWCLGTYIDIPSQNNGFLLGPRTRQPSEENNVQGIWTHVHRHLQRRCKVQAFINTLYQKWFKSFLPRHVLNYFNCNQFYSGLFFKFCSSCLHIQCNILSYHTPRSVWINAKLSF